MKLKKILAAVSATAVAATTLAAFATTASAAITSGDSYDIANAIAEKGIAEYVDASDIMGVKLTITGEGLSYYEDESGNLQATVDEDGFGGGVMVNTKSAGWVQKDEFSGWGNAGQTNNVVVTLDDDGNATYTVTAMFDASYFTQDDITSAPTGGTNEDGTPELAYAQIVTQQWWGGDIAIEYTILDADGNDVLAAAVAAKAAAEQAAADALADLQEAIEGLGVNEVISDMEAAAEALTNAAEVLAKADEAAAEVEALEDVLAAAEEAFAALKENDTADREAYAAAKEAALAAIEDASGKLAEAKAKLQAAIDAFNEELGAQIAAKDETIADLEDAKAALEAELAALKAQAEADAAKIAELESAIAEKDAAIAALEDEKAALAADLEEALKNAGNGDDKPADDKPADDKPADDNPATGVAVAFGGIALAAVAAVAAKKRK